MCVPRCSYAGKCVSGHVHVWIPEERQWRRTLRLMGVCHGADLNRPSHAGVLYVNIKSHTQPTTESLGKLVKQRTRRGEMGETVGVSVGRGGGHVVGVLDHTKGASAPCDASDEQSQWGSGASSLLPLLHSPQSSLKDANPSQYSSPPAPPRLLSSLSVTLTALPATIKASSLQGLKTLLEPQLQSQRPE